MKRTFGMMVALLGAGCGSDSSSSFDARPSTVDARIAVDAPTAAADAPITTTDARVVDAPLQVPDGPVQIFDAPPAGGPDASATATCLPQCFGEIIGTLMAGCPQAGACTTSTNLQTFTTTICYASGVKVISMIGAGGLTTTVKKTNGDVCYTVEVGGTETSGSITYKDATGTTVLQILVPNTSTPNLVDYVCGGGEPIHVDLNSAQCQVEMGDAGAGGPDAGSSCTMDPACMP